MILNDGVTSYTFSFCGSMTCNREYKFCTAVQT
jgi:hypothetical protein